MEDKFIGARKVEFVSEETELKTPAGNPVVVITYVGGAKEIMPKESFEFLVTAEATDYTALRNKKLNDLVLKLLAVIAESDFKAGDIEDLKLKLESELMNAFNRATHYLWTGDDKSFIPGYNTVYDKSLIEAHKVALSIIKNESQGETQK